MKIKVDRNYVESYQLERVKEDMSEFKAMYTDNDILRALRDELDWHEGEVGDVVYMNVEAIDSGWAYGNVTHFVVSAMIDDRWSIYKVRFCVNMNLDIINRHMVSIMNYRLSE